SLRWFVRPCAAQEEGTGVAVCGHEPRAQVTRPGTTAQADTSRSYGFPRLLRCIARCVATSSPASTRFEELRSTSGSDPGFSQPGLCDPLRYGGVDRRHRALPPYPGIAAEVQREDLLRGACRQRLRRERRIDAADTVRQRRVVGNEQPLDEPGLAI